MKKITALILCAIALASGFVWGIATAEYGVFPHRLLASAISYRSPLVEARREFFSTLAGERDIVFFGDSITHLVPWGEVLPDLNVADRAIDGDTSADGLARIADVARLDAGTYVIMFGVNDIGRGIPKERTVANIRRIVAMLPGRKLLAYVTPCSPSFPGCDQPKIDALNRDLAQIDGVTHFHIGLDPRRDLADARHPNARGITAYVAAVNGAL